MNRLASASTTTPVVIGLALSMAATFAHAANDSRADRMKAELQKRFTAADANADGRLTREEAKDKMPQVYKHFDEIDSAHAGSVTIADIAAFAREKRGARADK